MSIIVKRDVINEDMTIMYFEEDKTMNKNAVIKATLGDLLEILDARTNVYIFEEDNGYQNCIRTTTPVYGILTDRAFLKKYSDYKVIGLNKTLGSTSILIDEV